ncbi:MAG: tRNA dihydrouridine synthase DusB [Planctomycetes bacterium]|nr:tRNA dihydrouridine synthase DusB [Planctomycetota bacterium]
MTDAVDPGASDGSQAAGEARASGADRGIAARTSEGRFASALNHDVPLARPAEFRPLALGRLRVWPPVVLAPMAGVTNYPFRKLCREFGAGIYVSEMITARGFLMGNSRTILLASSRPDESPRSVQIYSSDPVDIGEMVARLVDQGVDHVDLNLGCPVPKVTASGGGSAIPVKPRLMARLVRAMVKRANAVPVTVKVRKGIDAHVLTYLDAGRVASEEGASAIGLHARTAAELYHGAADWDAIGELKARATIPVLGNGDVWEAFDALRMMRATGCDGVIVGRGCLGRPWLFRELADVFGGDAGASGGREPAPPPKLGEIAAIMRRHAHALAEFFGEKVGVQQMRKWTSWYTKGFHGSAALRDRLHRIDTLADLDGLLAELDPDESFPLAALRVSRAKGGRVQKVSLPPNYLAQRDDDTPPRSPHSLAEIEAWERALNSG